MYLASCMPIRASRPDALRLTGGQVSNATARWWAEQAGAHYEAVQTVQTQQPHPVEPVSLPPLKQAMSSYGAYVLLINGEWAEVRTLAIGEADGHLGEWARHERPL